MPDLPLRVRVLLAAHDGLVGLVTSRLRGVGLTVRDDGAVLRAVHEDVDAASRPGLEEVFVDEVVPEMQAHLVDDLPVEWTVEWSDAPLRLQPGEVWVFRRHEA